MPKIERIVGFILTTNPKRTVLHPSGKRWIVSTEGGEEPTWSPQGDKLYYRNGKKWLEVVINHSTHFSVAERHFPLSSPYINVSGYSY